MLPNSNKQNNPYVNPMQKKAASDFFCTFEVAYEKELDTLEPSGLCAAGPAGL
jgi:hypothetical protein